jgi:hypothetical protein
VNRAADVHRSERITAEMVFASRNKRSQTIDRVKLGELGASLEAWLQSPTRLELPGFDSPNGRLIFSQKSRQDQVTDLLKAAKKTPLEIWIKDTKTIDIKNAKPQAPRERVVRRFKVQKKGLLERKPKKPEPLGRKLPTSEEIIQKAKENVMEQNAKKGLPPITPEVSELRETGEISKARDELMRTEATTRSQIEQYVHDLNEQLEPEGFRVVPID